MSNQGGLQLASNPDVNAATEVPVKADGQPKTGGVLRQIVPYHNDQFRKLKYTELFLNLALWGLLATQIAATQQTLAVAPYSYIAALMVFSCLAFWLLAIVELVNFTALTKELIRVHSKQHGYEKKNWFVRFVLGRWSCGPRVLALFGSLIMLFLITSFVFPENFYSTKTLEIYRIASVTHTEASFFIRSPVASTFEVYAEYRVVGSNAPATRTANITLTAVDDYTGFPRATGLTPDTLYEWRLSVEPLTVSRKFKTNPAPGVKSSFNFIFGSCFTANFPYRLGATAFAHFEELNPAFMAIIGDFVYADVPVYRGDSLFDYRSLYRQNFLNPTVTSAMQKIPTYMMYDDHEIFNDFNRGDVDAYIPAIDEAWAEYVGRGNPVRSYTEKEIYFFDVDYGDTAFFYLDLRYNRTDMEKPDGPNKSILGPYQKSILKQWLLDRNATATFKFLVSPLFWTVEFPGVNDGWGAFKTERAEIFKFIADNRISGVLFLSGDYHMPYVVELDRPGSGLYEISASPIDAFDYRLGGYAPYSDDPFTPLAERTERVLWYDIGPKGSVSFFGQVAVNSLAPTPYVNVSIWDRVKIVYSLTLTIDQLKSF